jgi:hypothetical protein
MQANKDYTMKVAHSRLTLPKFVNERVVTLLEF